MSFHFVFPSIPVFFFFNILQQCDFKTGALCYFQFCFLPVLVSLLHFVNESQEFGFARGAHEHNASDLCPPARSASSLLDKKIRSEMKDGDMKEELMEGKADGRMTERVTAFALKMGVILECEAGLMRCVCVGIFVCVLGLLLASTLLQQLVGLKFITLGCLLGPYCSDLRVGSDVRHEERRDEFSSKGTSA